MKSLELSPVAVTVEGWFHVRVQHALTELFQTKQLFQSVTVDLNPVMHEISEIRESSRPMGFVAGGVLSPEDRNKQKQGPYREALNRFTAAEWNFDTESYPQRTSGHNGGAGPVFFRTPTIKVACNHCDAIFPPHNSGYPALKDKVSSMPLGYAKDGAYMQAFAFPFLCQSCKIHPLVYLVTRRGLKLTLTGRSEFPVVDVSKIIPEQERDYFRRAVISEFAGQALAALFYLRVFVEQYLRRVTGAAGRLTGDELGDLYRPLLHDDFPKGFPSLAKIYNDLSRRLHDADASHEAFQSAKTEIERHFRQLELLPLKS